MMPFLNLLAPAAYIAAHNKAAYDKAVFDGRAKGVGRVRGSKALQSDRQVCTPHHVVM
jgi:hypothetical protein